MQPTTPDPKQSMSPVKKFAPLALVAVAVIAVVAVNLTSKSDDKQPATPGQTSKGPDSAADAQLMPGTMTFAKAKAEGKESTIDWGARCDTGRGMLALPLVPPPPCYAPFSGDNGGATGTGVTADTIKVVLYLAQQNDPVLRFIYDQIGNDDTPDQTYETAKGFVSMYNTYYETYGRRVELVRFDASGVSNDPVSAVADAETIAKDIKPFFVVGGPVLTNAFADTLAANRINCISCTPPQPDQWYRDRAPHVWDVQKNSEQSQLMAAEYIGKRLKGGNAVHAGDPALQSKPRVFGYVHVQASDSDPVLEKLFTDRLKNDHGVGFATIQVYQLPTELPGTGRDLITKLKDAGVTSVVLSVDPLAPQALTRIATEQNYFPEWIVTGSALVDATTFSRTYDQRQWAHAFGPSNLFARVAPSVAGAEYLYRWFFKADPPADQTVPLLSAPYQVLFGAIQAMGPTVTSESFEQALGNAPFVKATTISPRVSYGNRDIFPGGYDYTGLDDQTEIWWDPDATGPDDLGREGTGMWRYVDGGKRYLPGEWPSTAPNVFTAEGSVTIVDEVPAEVAFPTYEPLPAKG